MTVTIVVAIGSNGVIGNDGEMPWPRTGDQQQFKALTMGHPIVMGRTTYESIGRPLPGRTSIVLTRNADWHADGVEVAHTLTEALALALGRDDEAFLIGGAQVYAEALAEGLVDRMVVTHVHLAPEGDAWFPALDWSAWTETSREAYDGYDIATYDRT
ncbi:diacylglycerol kinase [Aeromicrobium sp. Root344]|uniref:dihydrofolate reductase n=1 Tax=Aeromicrobium sp. Root344 TaxID=1736521 RepID=UPI0006F29502|nr:dihydrofolate reductase [Aeromicrobium sp. Root344]KQV76885.1 diacylglycerol kinase [Aeromicrobium sp. Root344]